MEAAATTGCGSYATAAAAVITATAVAATTGTTRPATTTRSRSTAAASAGACRTESAAGAARTGRHAARRRSTGTRCPRSGRTGARSLRMRPRNGPVDGLRRRERVVPDARRACCRLRDRAGPRAGRRSAGGRRLLTGCRGFRLLRGRRCGLCRRRRRRSGCRRCRGRCRRRRGRLSGRGRHNAVGGFGGRARRLAVAWSFGDRLVQCPVERLVGDLSGALGAGGRFAAAQRFAQSTSDRCLYGRRRGFNEFALFIQSGEHFLAGNTEFLSQLVYAGLTCHYISCLRGDSRGPRLGFSYDAWSSGLHGVLMFFATCSLPWRVERL
jgi:hypothetical protein